MENLLFLLASVLAVALLVGLNWLIGGWRALRLEDEAAAVSRYRQDYWDDAVSGTARDENGRAALMTLEGADAIGLVALLGDKMVTRRLDRGMVKAATLDGEGRLVLMLADFVLPRVTLTLRSEQAARDWHGRLLRLAPGAAARRNAV